MTPPELAKLLDALIWSHAQVRKQDPEVPRTERITETANVLLERCDLGALALVAADAIDRLGDVASHHASLTPAAPVTPAAHQARLAEEA